MALFLVKLPTHTCVITILMTIKKKKTTSHYGCTITVQQNI